MYYLNYVNRHIQILAKFSAVCNDLYYSICSRIMEILGKMLRLLHRALPWDTLDGHRQRFVGLYNELRKVYERLSNIQYLRGILQVRSSCVKIVFVV